MSFYFDIQKKKTKRGLPRKCQKPAYLPLTYLSPLGGHETCASSSKRKKERERKRSEDSQRERKRETEKKEKSGSDLEEVESVRSVIAFVGGVCMDLC